MPPGGHLRPLGGGFLITVAAHKCGLHLQQHGGVHQQQTLPQRTNADCISLRRGTFGDDLSFASAHKCGLHPFCAGSIFARKELCLSAQMRIASIIKVRKLFTCPLCLSAQMRIASTMNGIRSPALKLCLSAQMRIASSSATTYHLILFFASAHKCGLHLRDSRLHGGIQNLCLSAQMRIASPCHIR